MTDFTKAIASTDQPMATFKALEALVDKTIGVKLFTLMEVDNVRGVARRNYSNMPDAYATSGEKPIQDNSWTEQVQGRHETFVANSIEAIKFCHGCHRRFFSEFTPVRCNAVHQE